MDTELCIKEIEKLRRLIQKPQSHAEGTSALTKVIGHTNPPYTDQEERYLVNEAAAAIASGTPVYGDDPAWCALETMYWNENYPAINAKFQKAADEHLAIFATAKNYIQVICYAFDVACVLAESGFPGPLHRIQAIESEEPIVSEQMELLFQLYPSNEKIYNENKVTNRYDTPPVTE